MADVSKYKSAVGHRPRQNKRAPTMQDQGVPIPERLPNGPQRKASPARTRENRGTPGDSSNSIGVYSPTRLADKSVSGIGLLEAEFLVTIGLLVLIMFANSSASYTSRIMSFIKRGALTCLAFFLLALIATIGPNAAKIAKAFGALVVVAIFLSTPIYSTDQSGNPTGVLADLDNLIKNDWVGTNETGNDTAAGSGGSGSSNQGAPTTNSISIGSQIANAIKSALSGVVGVPTPAINGSGIVSTIQRVLQGLGL